MLNNLLMTVAKRARVKMADRQIDSGATTGYEAEVWA